MKLTKNSYAEFKLLYNDLTSFLADLKYDTGLRMVALEHNAVDADSDVLSYFDSDSGQIGKETLKVKRFGSYGNVKVMAHFKTDGETAIIESYSPSNGDAENGMKKQSFYVIFDFKERVTGLLYDFLKLYQQHILHYFYSRNAATMEDIIEVKQNLFNDAVKQYIDPDIIVTLSGSQYEKRDSAGSIIYVKNRRDAQYKIKFASEIDFNLNNLRLLRKLLEMSDNKLSLVVYEKKVVGLGVKDTDYRKVQFNGHQKWTLFLSQKETLRFSHGKFFFDRGGNQRISDMPKGFILKKYEKVFNTLINILTRQKHGALLIITDAAKAEVDRLSGFARGYTITPIDFTNTENLSLIRSLSSVDGAVFIDRHLKCYGAGIILDGVAQRHGSTARGARYNSACCYLDNKNDGPYAAVVFSEDETMDVILNAVAAAPKKEK